MKGFLDSRNAQPFHFLFKIYLCNPPGMLGGFWLVSHPFVEIQRYTGLSDGCDRLLIRFITSCSYSSLLLDWNTSLTIKLVVRIAI